MTFYSSAQLVAADTNTTGDVYYWSDQAGLQLVTSPTPIAVPPPGPLPFPMPYYANQTISADGQTVLFLSTAQLTADDPDTQQDVYRWTPDGGLELVSAAQPGGLHDGSSSASGFLGGPIAIRAMADDGSTIVFQSSAQLTAGDDGQQDIYLWQAATPGASVDLTATEVVTDNPAMTTLTAAGTFSLSDADLLDTHIVSVDALIGNLGALTASVTQDTTGSGTGGMVSWNYEVDESAVDALTAPAIDAFSLTVADNAGGTSIVPISVALVPADWVIT